MGEFEEKLNSILGDKEAMGQIMALAQSWESQRPPLGAPEEETREPGWERPAHPRRSPGRGRIPCPCWAAWIPGWSRWGCAC